MESEVLEKVVTRNNFYRDSYRKVMFSLLVMALVNCVLVGIVYYQLTHRPEPRYFASTRDGRIIRLYALSSPVLTQEAVSELAVRGVLKAYTFNFSNYKENLETASQYFTGTGWERFKEALQKSGMLEFVIRKRLVASAVATAAPTLLKKGVIGGRYSWQFQVPILVTYESQSEKQRQALVVTVMIQRVSIVNHPRQVAISMFVASSRQLNY